jgi:hypothetical protein
MSSRNSNTIGSHANKGPATLIDIPIDDRDVPEYIKVTDTFREFRADLLAACNNARHVKEVCIHEAAHAYYLRAAAGKALEFDGPKITYNRERNSLESFTAFVRATAMDETIAAALTIGEWVLRTAQTYAAGGIAVKVYRQANPNESSATTSRHLGDSKDCEQFEEWFPKFQKQQPKYNQSMTDLWTAAENQTYIDLQKQELWLELYEIADGIRAALFPSIQE